MRVRAGTRRCRRPARKRSRLLHLSQPYFHPPRKLFVPSSMDLTDAQWEAIRRYVPGPELDGTSDKGGRPWRDPRDVLHGILWVLRTGAPWADMPTRYPPYATCFRRFQKWEREASSIGYSPRSRATSTSGARWTSPKHSSTAPMPAQKKGPSCWANSTRQGDQGHGSGRRQWSSYRRRDCEW